MSALSDYLENALINHIFRNTDFTRPANIYVALFTAAPSDSGGGTEVSGGSYARQAVVTGASSGWAAASGGATENSATITFPTATASWGTITHVALFDASSGGNMLFHGALAVSKAIGSGDIFRINAGDLDLSLT
jgi:hypothetical protein